MPDRSRKSKQKTSKGLEIPVPTKGEFDANLAKVAPPAGRKRPGGKDQASEAIFVIETPASRAC